MIGLTRFQVALGNEGKKQSSEKKDNAMKKLSVILAAAILVSMICVVNVQADTWLLGTSNTTTLTYDGTNFSMPATMFNFSLINDPHMWNYGFTGPYDNYTYTDETGLHKPHKFQSAPDAFKLTINSSGGVWAYDRGDTPNTTVRTSTNQYWAITLNSNLNTPIRGLSAEGLTVSGNHITGNLVSDGIFHWYGNFPDTNMWSAENYYDKFYFDFSASNISGDLYTGTMQVYATNTPLPGTLLLLGSGLAGLAFYRRRRKSCKG